ncbi:ATP-binding protein [Peterkaempfera sp. SMS 1(5)a]|uniref:ATP-binding protein n=1 Tax=Peterkaempfera podocarpi TaxID=3232308 RepID=UPI0036730D9A
MPVTTGWTQLTLTARQVQRWPDADAAPPPRWWEAADRVAFRLPSLEKTVPVCRGLVRAWLDARQVCDGETQHSLMLIVSEFLANAIRHSASIWITCRLWTSGDLLFVEVRDQGGSLSVPRVHRNGATREHGRGLALAASSAREWGWLAADGGCAVWATVAFVPCGGPQHAAPPIRLPEHR